MPCIVGIGGEIAGLDLVALLDRRASHQPLQSSETRADRAIAAAADLAGGAPDSILRCADGTIDQSLAAAIAAAETASVTLIEETSAGIIAIMLAPTGRAGLAQIAADAALDDTIALADIGHHRPDSISALARLGGFNGTIALIRTSAELQQALATEGAPSLSGLAAIALSLYDRRIPGTGDTARDPEWDALCCGHPHLDIPAFPHPWITRSDRRRRGLVVLPSSSLLTLEEARPRRADWRPVTSVAPHVQVLSAPDIPLLAERLELVGAGSDIEVNQSKQACIANLVAQDGPTAVRAALALAEKLRGASQSSQDIVDQNSASSAVPTPLGAAPIAFVFPGFGSSHTGLGDRLMDGAPHLLDEIERSFGDRLADIFPIAELYRGHGPQARRGATIGDVATSLSADFFFAGLYATIARELLGLKPAAAIGVSLGGTTMVPALCRDPLEKSRILLDTPGIIAATLSLLVDEYRDLDSEGEELPPDEWVNYWMIGPTDQLLPRMATTPDVFPCIVCHDSLTLIGGANGAIRRFATENRAGLRQIRTRLRHLHTGDVRNHATRLFEPVLEVVSTIDREPLKGIDFYVSDRPIRAGASRAALNEYMRSQINATCEIFDFPAIVRAAYRRGIRVFVECGPLDHTTRWIKRILDPLPHVAVALAPGHLDAWQGIVAAAAQLAGHGIGTFIPSDPPWIARPQIPQEQAQ